MVCLCLSGCGGGPSNPGSDLEALVSKTSRTGLKVLLVGIDGATFDLIGPMAAQGRLPTMRRLLENGTRGALQSQTPMKSPALWTTIVTGMPRQVHAIQDFKVGEKLVTSTDRDCLALWDITSPFGIRNGWCGFWATYPAEPLNGWMLSDRIARSRFSEWNDGAKTTHSAYPPGLIEDVHELVVDPLDPPMEEIRSLVRLTPEEEDELLQFDKPQHGHGLSVLKFAYCTQRSYEQMALRMLESGEQPDLMGVFLVASDSISHTFWHYHRPDEFPNVDRRDAQRLGKIVPGIYQHNDRFLGELLQRVDPETVVILVSDHGFQSSGRTPQPRPVKSWAVRAREAAAIDQVAVGQPGMHHIDGAFLAAGGPFKRQAVINLGIEDITPTILALLGLPVPRDMTGRVPEEALDPDFLAKHPIRYVDSYEDLIDRQPVETSDTDGEARLRAQLEALGYIDEGASR